MGMERVGYTSSGTLSLSPRCVVAVAYCFGVADGSVGTD